MDRKVSELLEQMTLEEKIGQLCLISYGEQHIDDAFRQSVVEGRVGAILNQVDSDAIGELQEIATSESRLGIPLLFARDVIHGFRTIFPIPLGQAASWNPEMVELAARTAALEAARVGINWTFAPMLDVTRDPRWGRVAESLGEDPYLTSILASSMVRGFQGDDLAAPGAIAACAKHFAGYGASESGRDYNTINISENELRNVHLPPFKAAIDAGVASIMTSFSDLDGIPASANEFLLKQILRTEWRFDGLVVSDWDSIGQLVVHGLTEDDKDSACRAANAGVDMEMASRTYANHLATLIDEGKVAVEQLDAMVSRVLGLKVRLGLFDDSRPSGKSIPVQSDSQRLTRAKEAALQSIVLLSNKNHTLPLAGESLGSIAVIGPLADDGYEQLGTWVFDGDRSLSQTPLQALRAHAGEAIDIRYCRAMATSRSISTESFADAVRVAKDSDVALLFLGEESILSGEAHCRADISLPGSQEQLILEIAATGTPVVLIIMAGRPLALQNIADRVDAILYAWHGGSMAGPAIVELLFGERSPSGKLPMTLPRVTGQVPIYYSHKNTGRPPTRDTVVRMSDIQPGAPQHSFGNTSFHMDIDHTPLFSFGHGLTYTEFSYSNISISPDDRLKPGDRFVLSADLTNMGEREATEVVQLYIRDLVGSTTRPVRQLKRFGRYHLKPGETIAVRFELTTDDLAFFGRNQKLATEPGKFHAWIGGCSEADLRVEFALSDR